MQELVCILGTTGVGKSRLAVRLGEYCAQHFGKHAEVLNSDAMQVYKALPILTAKVSEPEMRGVPHRMMSFLDPLKDEYVVLDFVKDAKRNVGWRKLKHCCSFKKLLKMFKLNCRRLQTFIDRISYLLSSEVQRTMLSISLLLPNQLQELRLKT